jgi:hypothetical protein
MFKNKVPTNMFEPNVLEVKRLFILFSCGLFNDADRNSDE